MTQFGRRHLAARRLTKLSTACLYTVAHPPALLHSFACKAVLIAAQQTNVLVSPSLSEAFSPLLSYRK